ncbi:MAG: S8 family serine peptidase [Terriglobales bacterium]
MSAKPRRASRTAAMQEAHQHAHAPNRFAVVPTCERLAADAELRGRGVTLALIDSGFFPHADLTLPANRIEAYHDVADPNAKLEAGRPQSWQWHGTMTSVAAAGNGHLSEGLYRGLASEASLVLVKASDQGRITEPNIARALQWVIENKDRYGIRVVSISLGGDDDVPYTSNAVDLVAEEAVRCGLVVVVAAGNSGCTENPRPVPPANAPSVITVGGYNDHNQPDATALDLYCSSFGPTADGLQKPEIIAPAMWVAVPILPGSAEYRRAAALSQLAAAPDNRLPSLLKQLAESADLPESLAAERPSAIRTSIEQALEENRVVATHYQHGDGTSFAAPVVASVVAQMLEANPQLTPAAVKDIMIATADRIPGESAVRQGYGVLNARRAVERAAEEQHALGPNQVGPPRVEAGQLVFRYHDDQARSVALAGDFNQWDPARHRFAREAHNIWRAQLEPPPPGRYRYKFVVDGTRWLDDPANAIKEPDEYGGLNSLLVLGEP